MSQTKAQLLNPLGELELTGQLVGVGATFSGNVSIAGTLTKQDVTNVDSVGLITARSGIEVTGGDITIPDKIVHRGDTNTAIRFSDADTISFETGGSARAFINSAGDLTLGATAGNLGKLYIKQGADTDSEGITFMNSGSSNTGRIFLGDSSGAVLHLGHGGLKQLNITQAGKIGIGTANPSNALDVQAGTTNTAIVARSTDAKAQISLVDNTTTSVGSVVIGAEGDALFFSSGSAGDERLRIDTGGRLLIGQTSGASLYANGLLQVSATDGNSAISVTRWSNNGSSPYINLGKSRGAVGAYTIVQEDDRLGQINFTGADGTDLASPAAGIAAYVDGTPGSNDMPGRLVFFTASDGGVTETERLRIGSSGQIGIGGSNFGTAGQVIVSGGSGSAPAWGDAAGGAEYAGISSGAMSAGDPVVVRDDGKLEKVKYSWNESITTGSVAEKNSINIPSSGVWASWARNDDGTTWDGDGSNDNRVLFLFRNSNSPSYITGTYEGNSLTLNSMSGWNDGDNVAIWSAAYNSNGKRFAVAYRHGGNGRIRVNSGRPSGNTVTWGTTSNNGRPEINSSSSSNAVGIEYAGNDKFMVVYGEGNKIFAQVVTNSSNNNYMELSAGTRTEIEDVGAAASYKLTVSKPDSNGRMLMFYRKALGGDFGLKYAILTISGTNVSYDGRAWVSSTNPVVLQTPLSAISYDPNEDRYLLTYERTSDNRLYGRNIKITAADAVSMSAETQLSTQNPYEGQGTVYDTNLKKHFVYFTDGSTNKLSYVPVTFTGSSAPTAGTLGVIYNTAHRMRSFTIDYDATLGKVLTGARNEDSGPNFLAGLINQTASSTSNLGNKNFLGFSKGSYTDGNTAKIGTLSALDENQTGLTTTTNYFVQPDGTLSTTASTPRVAAGKAVSSTNLIVRDDSPRQGILMYNQFWLRNCGSYRPWCTCRHMGAFDRNAAGGCNFCVGKWEPWCCNTLDASYGFAYTNNIADEGGGNMCIGCGGQSCGTSFCVSNCACNSNCPDGRFWFPSEGLYCYNLNLLWHSCQCRAIGGCGAVMTFFAGKKCHNRNCCTMYCNINAYGFHSLNTCNYCDDRFVRNNIRQAGIVSVPDKNTNFISWQVHMQGLGGGGCFCNTGFIQCEYGMYCMVNWLSFTKLSNDPGMTYCN